MIGWLTCKLLILIDNIERFSYAKNAWLHCAKVELQKQ